MTDPDRLWSRYWNIRDRHGNGYATPILWHLALRGHAGAMLELGTTFDSRGRRSDPFSQEGLAYRAFRQGEPFGAQHLAINAFNRRDLAGYRHWLARAARAGDDAARRELRRFELRLPHTNAAKIGRRRPHRRYDFE
jgi:hypothetical protein